MICAEETLHRNPENKNYKKRRRRKMKKMKKVFAVILSLAMVLGMSMTAFAAKEKATITVNGGDPGVWYSYVQVIKPDRKSVV